MARHDVKTVLEQSDKAWAGKQHWNGLIAECFEYALPDRNPYTGNGIGTPQGGGGTAKGQDKASRRVYDSTLQTDAIKITNRIQYELFPIGHQWATLQPGPFVPAEQQGAARGDLHSLQQVIFAAIQFSNFDLSISEWLLELVVAGTACMLVSPGDEDNPIVYQAVSQAHVALREGALGKIDLISRKHKMRITLVEQTWPDAKFDLDDRERKEDPEIDLIDVCYYSMRDKAWFYDVIVTGGVQSQKEKRIVERKHKICPWVIARWNKAAEEVQGRSLVMQALPDARVLSATKSFLLKHAALAIGGVFLVKNDGVVNANNVRVFPGATIPVRATGGPAGASIAPLQVAGQVNLADLIIKDLVNSIHKIMMNDGMPDISEGVRTATELIERMKELQQSLGAPFARILKEGIIPMLEITIDILAESGIVPIEPGQKIKLNSGQIEVKFASPLVQGQSIREVEAARNAMAMTGEAAGPEAVKLNFKVEDFGAWLAGKLGVVPELVRGDQERQQLQQAAGQMAAAGAMPPMGMPGGIVPDGGQQQAGPAPMAA